MDRFCAAAAFGGKGVSPLEKVMDDRAESGAELTIDTDTVGPRERLANLVSDERTEHILNGEIRPNGTFGGGHRAGTGFPGKSEFPASWSDEEIMNHISDIATDPSIEWRIGDRPGDFFANGTRDGIDVEVLIRNDEIWTGYPTNVPRNP